ncbi:MAG: hypothetical protein KF833_06470 [Verrucomicrobiae bacterium]|nr:hypothetical protein [Verrucomicrobiae bacterium]
MRFEFSLFCCRVAVEIFRLGTEPVFRRHRIVPEEAVVRRRLLRDVRRRLLDR